MEIDGRQDFPTPNVLTSIHSRIHCAATQEENGGGGIGEVDRIAVEHFIQVLAEVAMAVAARSEKVEGEQTNP